VDAQFDGNIVTLAAADGFRLAVYRHAARYGGQGKSRSDHPGQNVERIEPADRLMMKKQSILL